ncbi:MAG: diguanylate cyclase [Candidatus Lambdaproteobacteria bacterium]|nr:diguanylate cyclase [Candidatus Lambdaproteobacteria bacterium]
MLIVEPRTDLRERIARALATRAAVKGVADLAAAVAARRWSPELLILSRRALRGLPGSAAASLTARVPARKTIVLAGRGAHAGEADLPGELAGADAIVTEPVRLAELLTLVARLWELALLEQEAERLGAENRRLAEQMEERAARLQSRLRDRNQELARANQELKASLGENATRLRELERLNGQLTIQATIDPLTELYNRREFNRLLHAEWARFTRYKRPFSLILLDIDRFKRVNDEHGHECGDAVLRGLGTLLRTNKRRQDFACRFGGEEFVLVLPDTPLAAAFMVAETLRRRVARHVFRHKDVRLQVHISSGVAGVVEHAPRDESELIKFADHGMYHAKQLGRNRTAIADPVDPERVLRADGDPPEGAAPAAEAPAG